MIRFEVTGETLAEFRDNFAGILGAFIPLLKPAAQPGTAAPPADAKVVDVTATVVAEEPPKEKPRTTAKEKKPVEQARKYTVDEVRAKLKTLGENVDHEVCWRLLKKYDVRRASNVPPEKFAEVVDFVDAMLAPNLSAEGRAKLTATLPAAETAEG